MIEAEVGEDVFQPNDNSGKLALLETWLYGGVSEVDPRLAPSIIARSEAELLGISSPRFAIRVYLKQGSFVNIRRRKVTARQIRNTYDEDLADSLQGLTLNRLAIKNSGLSESEKQEQAQGLENAVHKKVNWIADCLLVPPKRLLDEHYKFLTCSLGTDYGEDEMEPATPFVTHISIGGGLCAQAACFMAMCLLEHSDIFGISEITLLASEGEGTDEVEIHGLKPRTMVNFFERVGLAAQLQEGVAQESLMTVGEIRREIDRIRAALRIYVDNKIPILPMLSASRMQGLRPLEETPSIPKPIIVSSGDRYSEGSTDIPLGKPLDYRNSTIVEQRDLAHDNHCVVIVGRNEDASTFLLNDPATFPFIKCSPAQIFDARAYRSFAKDKDIPSRRYVLSEVTEADLGRFQFISVGPKGANLWLLNFAGDAFPQRGGLLGAVQKSLNSHLVPMGISYDNYVSQIQNLDLHLGRWSGTRGFAFRSGFEIANDLGTELERAGMIDNRWYWLSYIDQPDLTGEYVESFSFWDASQQWRPGIVLKDFLYCVVARKADGTLHTTFQGEHVT
jgi:hypothetical protein